MAIKLLVPYRVDSATNCWNWNGYVRKDGRAGQIRSNGVRVSAYVAFYVQKHGAVAANCELDHTCHNRRCVNPDHLEPVPHLVNMRRGRATKLTRDQIAEIRRRSDAGERRSVLANEFGVTRGHVSLVARGLACI